MQALNEALLKLKQSYFELSPGQHFVFDTVTIEILGIKNPELTHDADFSPVNNQSVVMRAEGGATSVLFTGDLGGGGGDAILNGPFKNKLKADYVQMAHHGQHGVYRSFYEAVAPEYCLWPTPLWLWNNDNGRGYNSGHWLTLEVRKWMEDLKVKEDYVAGNGLYCINFYTSILTPLFSPPLPQISRIHLPR